VSVKEKKKQIREVSFKNRNEKPGRREERITLVNLRSCPG